MENASYIALSGQTAREHQMEVLANNIANLSTPGFKAERMMFKEYLSKPDDGSDPSSYVVSQGNARDMSQGNLTHTGNPLDVALNGNGFMTVTTPSGNQYTRNGHLQIDNQGELVTTTGFVVQGDGGSPIVVPSGAASITIGKDGTVATEKQTIGKISVVNFDNPQILAESQGGLYATTQTPTPATGTTVEQGTIEEANLQPVVEMTKLMDTAHQMGLVKNFVDGEHTRLKNAIDRLGKTV
ncbi:MAG TPA: flagellar basal-body rod protein FlgF [Stellaceae bacterium]|jgi:flagellar basal-body rod protein FlgF|nr:flagellar basal-body rod protein FlgF [Stellaceae bacterium]